jgi:hypothetical protein
MRQALNAVELPIYLETETKAVSMWCWPWSAFRTMVVSLLMLALPFVYAASGRASSAPHGNVMAATSDEAVAFVDYGEALCDDAGLLHHGACCSATQCVTMHGGLPADVVEVFVPRLDTSTHLPAPALPEGISSDPALRPPCPTI